MFILLKETVIEFAFFLMILYMYFVYCDCYNSPSNFPPTSITVSYKNFCIHGFMVVFVFYLFFILRFPEFNQDPL